MLVSKKLGGTCVVVGTIIGSGMLALPLSAVPIGFWPSSVLLSMICIVMSYSAIVIARISAKFDVNLSIPSMMGRVLGSWAEVIATIATLMLLYFLLAAYLAGATDTIYPIITHALGRYMSNSMLCGVITLTLGAVIAISMALVDYINRILIALKLVLFSILCWLLVSHIKLENFTTIVQEQAGNIGTLCTIVPIFFTAFGFHGSVPVIISYLERDYETIRKIFIWGSTFSLFVYIIWQVVIIGTVAGEQHKELPELIKALSNIASNPYLGAVAVSFTLCAIISSFLGVGIGIFDFFMGKINNVTYPTKAIVSLLTFLPPLIISVTNYSVFTTALGFASVALSILAVVLPSAAMLKLQLQDVNANSVNFLCSRIISIIFNVMLLLFGIFVIFLELYNVLRSIQISSSAAAIS